MVCVSGVCGDVCWCVSLSVWWCVSRVGVWGARGVGSGIWCGWAPPVGLALMVAIEAGGQAVRLLARAGGIGAHRPSAIGGLLTL